MTNCVVFSNVRSIYPPNEDVVINFERKGDVSPNYSTRDWVGLFRCGWTSIRDYHTFEWVPQPTGNGSVSFFQVSFPGRRLPYADDGKTYEFCYIDHYDVLRGSSIPFVFTKATGRRSDVVAVDVIEGSGPGGSIVELRMKGKKEWGWGRSLAGGIL